MTYRSITTVKADVARRWFRAEGDGIVWAVVDSGIDRQHPHFTRHRNLELAAPLLHRDFTAQDGEGDSLTDALGHGTHVAATIAGEMLADDGPIVAFERERDIEESGEKLYPRTLAGIAGMSPRTKLLSLKVIDENGAGRTSTVIAALDYIQNLNQFGRRLQVHGVNLSLAYDWDAKWFACGESPLCIEVNRLAQSGVIVVVSAGNTGYGLQATVHRSTHQGYGLSINDPGNAELAITVGSTHRDQPLTYGVSYFSSKGPTLDGRAKPDLVAPGEYIMSAMPRSVALAAMRRKNVDLSDYGADTAFYQEDSGTAMAAAHVSGVAAAFLSVRRELIGHPAEVKSILMRTATSLNRHQHFQGAGLVDLLRALFPTAVPTSLSAATPADASAAPTLPPPVVSPLPGPGVSAQPNPTSPKGTGVRLMISYAHEDEKYKAMLTAHLSALSRSGRIEVWQDREIRPGQEYAPEILKQIDQANIIVLLVSADFLASDYCYLKEMARAIERHKRNEVRVIPVIVRDVDWKETPIRGLNALPKDGLAVTSWDDIDKAWHNVAAGIRTAVQEIMGEQ